MAESTGNPITSKAIIGIILTDGIEEDEQERVLMEEAKYVQ